MASNRVGVLALLLAACGGGQSFDDGRDGVGKNSPTPDDVSDGGMANTRAADGEGEANGPEPVEVSTPEGEPELDVTSERLEPEPPASREPEGSGGAVAEPSTAEGSAGESALTEPEPDPAEPAPSDVAPSEPNPNEPSASEPEPVDTVQPSDDGVEVTWTALLGEQAVTWPIDVAADEEGNAYVVGHTLGRTGSDVIGRTAPRIVKVSVEGSAEWQQPLARGFEGEGFAGAAATGPGGAVYGAAAFGTGWPYHTGILDRFDPDGNPVWSEELDVLDAAIPSALAVDVEGNVYVGGSAYTIAEDGTPAPELALLASYTEDGEQRWAQTWGADYGFTNSLTLSAAGELYAVGGHYGQTVANFLAKYDRDGTQLWERLIPSSVNASGSDVAIDGEGRVFVVSVANGSAELNGYDTNGDGFFSEQWPAWDGEGIIDIAIDGAGNVFTSSTLLNTYTRQAELRKFDPAGVLLWTTIWDSTDQSTEGLTVAGSDILMVGSITNTLDGVSQTDGYLRRLR